MSIDRALPQPVLLKIFHPLAPAVGPLLVGLAYYSGAEAAFAIGTLTHMFAPFWPPNVVLFCALLFVPQRRWYVLAAFAAHLAAERGVAMPVPQLLMHSPAMSRWRCSTRCCCAAWLPGRRGSGMYATRPCTCSSPWS